MNIVFRKEVKMLLAQNNFNSIYSSETIAKALHDIYHYISVLFYTQNFMRRFIQRMHVCA